MGNGALGALQRYAALDEIDAIYLSHLHADHCLDMCGYCVAQLHAPDGRRPKIAVYGPARTAERLSRALALDSGSDMTDAFEFVTLEPGTMDVGPMRITTARMNHPVETFGVRIEHDGQVLAYSADTAPSDELVRLAAGADVLLCEASYIARPDLPPNLHLTARQAAEHATRAAAAELVLTHLVAWNDPATTLAEAAPAFGGDLRLASAGAVLLAGSAA